MAENLEISYGIPSIEHIKALYDEVIPLLKQLKTKADVIEFGEKHKVTMEINYDLAKLYDEKEPIEVIRCEAWGDLNYIYVYTNGVSPMFDVWCDFGDFDFIDGISIKDLDKSYTEGIKMLWYMNETREDDLKAIVEILHNHGISYDEMETDYKLDKNVIDKCRN